MAILIDFLLIFILIASALAFLGGLFVLFFRPPRRRGVKLMGFSFVVMIIAGVIAGTLHDQRAIQAGFLSAADQKQANEFGYVSAERWNQNRHAVLSEQKASEAKEEKPEQDVEPKSKVQITEKAKEFGDDQSVVQSAQAQTNQSKRFLKNSKMTEDVVAAFRTHHDLEAEPIVPGTSLCRDDGYCDFLIDNFQIQIYGNGIAQILTSTQAPHSKYRELCATMFSGLSGADIGFAREAIEAAFGHASQAGEFRQDVNSVEINVSPDLNNILACEFLKFSS